ncbi:MAG: hypothetical protein J1E00_08010 [Oscillospiraceae bacterium]|nr:hypothetical protein [Oscillospiraceae bacterium]
MNALRRTLCAGLLLLLCLLLSCCGIRTEETSDDSVPSDPPLGGQVEDGDSFEAPEPMDALLRCVQATEEASSFSAVLEGSCSTQVLFLSYTQKVRSERTVTAEAMFSQSVSVSSLVRVGVQQYFHGNTVLVRTGDVHDLDSVDWSQNATAVSPETYRDSYGNPPRSLSNYLINRETVLSVRIESASKDEICVVCELDPVKSTVEYAKQVKTNGGLDELPVFSSVTLTVTMDGSYRPRRVRYQEVYDISIAILGETTCKTDYTETFSDFDAVTSVPERSFFEPFLTLFTAEYPEISSGYSFLSSLLGDDPSYEILLEIGERTIPMRLALNTASGGVLLRGETVDLLYDHDRYYLLSEENRLYMDAEELNRLLLPLTEQSVLPGAQGQGGGGPSLFSDLHLKTENGHLLLQAGDEKDFFHAEIDPRSLTLLSAEVVLSGSETPFRLSLKKTAETSPFPALTDCTDLTPSLSALSFLELIPSLRDGETLSVGLRVEGDDPYTADLLLSLQDELHFSVHPSSGTLPLSVYGQGEALTAVWEDLSLTGTYEDFTALLALLSGSQAQNVSPTELSFPRIVAEPGKLTLRFASGSSLTFAGSEIRLSGDALSAQFSMQGISAREVPDPPRTANRLAAKKLTAFLTDSVYPALLRGEAVAGDVVLTQNGEETSFRLRARLDGSFALGLTTVWNGAETDLLYTDGTLFLSHPAFNAFLPLEQLPVIADLFADPLQLLSGGALSPAGVSVSCDGRQLLLKAGDTTVTLKKNCFTVSGTDWEADCGSLAPCRGQNSFLPPDRSACIDLAALAERVAPLAAQKAFAFAGRYEDADFSAELSRLSFSLRDSGELKDVAVEFLPDGWSDFVRLFYDGDGLFADFGETRLFCLADALFPEENEGIFLETALSFDDLLAGVKKITFRNDVLELDTADAHLRISWKGDVLSGVTYSAGGGKLSLHSASFAPVQSPRLEQYTDLTPLAGLLQPLVATAESGSVAFDGKIDLRAFSFSLTDIRVSGAFRFSGAGAEGTVAILLPYLPGLTSDGVPLLQGNRLLTDCTMCSELFLTDGKLYMRRTVDATYGVLDAQPYTSTETVYLTAEEALADPMRALAFLLRLEPNVLAGSGSVSGSPSGNPPAGSLLLRASCAGNRYTLALNPQAILPAAERILLTAQTDGGYVTGIGAEVRFPHLSLVASGTLLAHGDADPSSVLRQDFSGYLHLHN